MINFQDQYRRAYESLGHPLTHREGRSETQEEIRCQFIILCPKRRTDTGLLALFRTCPAFLFGQPEWQKEIAKRLGLESAYRPTGRPRKVGRNQNASPG